MKYIMMSYMTSHLCLYVVNEVFIFFYISFLARSSGPPDEMNHEDEVLFNLWS